MGKLGNPKNTVEILQKYDFIIKKKYGQNFLIDTNILDKIIEAADITKEDFVLEIGPGIGTLTQYLCERAGKVVAVEVDKNLIPILEETLMNYDNVEVINSDILKVDLDQLIREKGQNKRVKVVANLPYYITTPIIMQLFESKIAIDNITVMVQKEVAERIKSGPGTKDYGSISVAVQYYANPKIVANVLPNCFIPKPKIASSVLGLTPYREAAVHVEDEKLFFQIVRSAFNQRRKTLTNGLYNGGMVDLSKDEISEAISLIGKAKNIRGEALTLEEFAKLSNVIYEKLEEKWII